MQTVLLRIWTACLLLHSAAAWAGVPVIWTPRGIGGGGALFAPSMNPLNPQEMYVGSDMADTFQTTDGGQHWSMLHYYQYGGNSTRFPITFCVTNQALRYGLSGNVPKRTADGGQTWSNLPGASGATYFGLASDPYNARRVILADQYNLYYSSNGGTTFTTIRNTGSFEYCLAGIFFAGTNIFVGSREGLLVSANGGASFNLSAISGIPAGQGMASFCGAMQGSTTRLWCVTMPTNSLSPGNNSDNNAWSGIYTLDYGISPSWTLRTSGINAGGGDFPFYVACATNNINRAYLAGGISGNDQVCIYRTVNGGITWTSCFLADNNVNIRTAWAGWSSPYFFGWGFGGNALGFTVSLSDPDYAAVTDYGYIHVTTNGGSLWSQAYCDPSDANPTNTASSKTKPYHGAGINETAAWWLDWTASNTVYACYTDIRGMVSSNSGASWLIPKTLTKNTTYETLVHPTNHYIYAAASSVHDLYSWDAYCKDGNINSGSGFVIYSTDKGATWATLHDFSHPVVGMAVDPVHPERLYAAIVNSDPAIGGVYVTSNLYAGASSKWGKLSNPPRTEGHPYKIRILNDGTIVAVYSARITSAFTQSSGIFVSTNAGSSWIDRTAANMQYYTKQLTISPFNPGQSNWFAGVWGEWGNTRDKGGLYYSSNRGVSWTRILGVDNNDPYKAVESCTFNPANSNELWLTTETYGLMICTNIWSAGRTFCAVTNFPFSFTMNVFFNPYDTNDIWVTTHGGGTWVGRQNEIRPTITNLTAAIVGQTNGVQFSARFRAGQKVLAQTSTNLVTWMNLATNWMLDDGVITTTDRNTTRVPVKFYRYGLSP